MPFRADPYVTRMNIQPRYEVAPPSPSPPFPIATPSFRTTTTTTLSQLRPIVPLVSTVAAYFGYDPEVSTVLPGFLCSRASFARPHRRAQDLKCADSENDALSAVLFLSASSAATRALARSFSADLVSLLRVPLSFSSFGHIAGNRAGGEDYCKRAEKEIEGE